MSGRMRGPLIPGSMAGPRDPMPSDILGPNPLSRGRAPGNICGGALPCQPCTDPVSILYCCISVSHGMNAWRYDLGHSIPMAASPSTMPTKWIHDAVTYVLLSTKSVVYLEWIVRRDVRIKPMCCPRAF